jgi:hypothetical protein
VAIDRPGCLCDEDRIVSGSRSVRGVANGSGGDETGDDAAYGTFHGILRVEGNLVNKRGAVNPPNGQRPMRGNDIRLKDLSEK